MKVVIAGGGPAGLYFAILMKKLQSSSDITIRILKILMVSRGAGVSFFPMKLWKAFKKPMLLHTKRLQILSRAGIQSMFTLRIG
jgi:flavin-dependent dehydrogenase